MTQALYAHMNKKNIGNTVFDGIFVEDTNLEVSKPTKFSWRMFFFAH
jgi:hypothetical protein